MYVDTLKLCDATNVQELFLKLNIIMCWQRPSFLYYIDSDIAVMVQNSI